MPIRPCHHIEAACCQVYNRGPYRQEQVRGHLPADVYHSQQWMPLLLRELVLALLRNSQLVMSISIDLRAALTAFFPLRLFRRPEPGTKRTNKPPGNEYPSVQYA